MPPDGDSGADIHLRDLLAGKTGEVDPMLAARDRLCLAVVDVRKHLDTFQPLLQERLEDRERWTAESREWFLHLRLELADLDDHLEALNRRLAKFL